MVSRRVKTCSVGSALKVAPPAGRVHVVIPSDDVGLSTASSHRTIMNSLPLSARPPLGDALGLLRGGVLIGLRP